MAVSVAYTARVKEGGTDPGVKDVAGKALAADLTWIFTTAPGGLIPLDCPVSLSYNAANNWINTAGFEYDPAGNQTRAVINDSGTQQQYRYDCAGRQSQVLDASGNVLATHAYGASNQRLVSVEGGVTKYFAWDGGQIIAEPDGPIPVPIPIPPRSPVLLPRAPVLILIPRLVICAVMPNACREPPKG